MGTFERKFFDSAEQFTYIGGGSLGGKAQGLVTIHKILNEKFNQADFPDFEVSIPRMTVLTTELFDEFMKLNHLSEVAFSDQPDGRIAYAFQNAQIPPILVGDLYALIAKVKSPLAIRSSSLLEDALYEPFAGIYATKMTPNNQFDTETRFHKLIEAIKFVYASTFFKDAKDYCQATGHKLQEEKMAVIIQEVVGQSHEERFYPDISGVARSFNYYPVGHAHPEDGIVSLALGLGRTIVDDGISWSYSPATPQANPPYNTVQDLLKQSQKQFWAVNMAKMIVYDPVKETEYLLPLDLSIAQRDRTLKFVSSTYDPQSDRIYPGYSPNGPQLINFAPILQMDQIPLNDLVKVLLTIAQESLNSPVEVEFAVTLDPVYGVPARFGFLQIRPMVVSREAVEIQSQEMNGLDVLLASENVLGNGRIDTITDIVFVKPENFDSKFTLKISAEIEQVNAQLRDAHRSYLLIGFGRWGSADPWLGIPISWGQIAGAKVIVEATLPEMNVDLSQGSHFFHNLTSFQISYFSVKHSGPYKIDWKWLNEQSVVREFDFIKHVHLINPLKIKVDGRSGRGVIKK
jgi:hypothetical protein